MRGGGTRRSIAALALAALFAAAPSARGDLRTGPAGMEGLCGSGLQPGGVATGDWNGDGNADLAATYPNFGVVVLCAGDGEGNFERIGEAKLERGVTTIAFGRLGPEEGGPAEPFLAVLNPALERIDLLFPSGDGLAARGGPWPTGGEPAGLAVGYLDEEERLPVVATANGATHDLTRLVREEGGFRAETFPLVFPGRPEPVPAAVAAGDLDGDGRRDDLAVASQKYDLVYTLMGEEDGSLDRRFRGVRCGRSPGAVAVGVVGEDRTPYFAVASTLDRGALLYRFDEESRFGFRRFAAVEGGRRPVALDILPTIDEGTTLLAMVERKSERWVIHLVDGEGSPQLLEQMRGFDSRLTGGRLGYLRNEEMPFLATTGERLLLFPLFVLEEGRMR